MRETGQAGEHAHRPALITLIEAILPDADIVNEPARTNAGAPDLLVQRRKIAVGYIETKDRGTNLDNFEQAEQFARYLDAFSNLITSNYDEFRWYREHREQPIRVVRVDDADAEQSLRDLLQDYYQWNSAQITDEHELARQLARAARTFQVLIRMALQDGTQTILDQHAAFRTVLIAELSEEEFSDLYAQTIAYGLLVARISMPEEEQLTRTNCHQFLPSQNEFLQNIFDDLGGRHMDPRLEWLVDDICTLLNGMDVSAVVRSFMRASDDDIVVLFYEFFLREYDAEERLRRGVIFTPKVVARFMVNGTNHLLQEHLNHDQGIMSAIRLDPGDPTSPHEVQVLDPATGTGTFLYEIIEHIWEALGEQQGLFNRYIRDDLLPRMFAFEVLMAPYVVTHLKIVLELQRREVELGPDDRLHLYLTNTLTDTGEVAGALPFQNWISRASVEASRIKREQPIMVVIGNPPYSVNSANLSDEARALVNRYRNFRGQPIREGGTLQFERNIQNDYVKFFSFAEQRINRTGRGILAYITSNSYLKSPTLRGMRESLLRSFDHIYIVDLGGRLRPGADMTDENVFPQIREGVAILIGVKRAEPRANEFGSVYLERLSGTREEKYRALQDGWGARQFTEVDLNSPNLTFSVGDRAAYFADWTLPLSAAGQQGGAIFATSGGAIVTARDKFVIGFSRNEVAQRIETFGAHGGSLEEASASVDVAWRGDWQRFRAGRASRWLRQNQIPLRDFTQPISYRPFDERYVFYHDDFLDTPARRTMGSLLDGTNYALVFGRSSAAETADHFLVTRHLVEAKCAERSRQCHAAPLWIDQEIMGVNTRTANFTPELRELLQNRIGLRTVDELEGDWVETVGALDILGYIYAVVNSNYYRERIADLVAEDFPRVPFTSDQDRFRILSEFGRELITVHTGIERIDPLSSYPVAGDDQIAQERWTSERDTGRIWINEEQHFDEVPRAVWEYRIGGWQVAQEWLKRRRNRVLTPEDIVYFQRVLGALQETLNLVTQIDQYVDDELIERGA